MDKVKLLQFFYNTLLPKIDNLAELKICLLFIRISLYLKKFTHKTSILKLSQLSGLSSPEVTSGLISARERNWLSFSESLAFELPVTFCFKYKDQDLDLVNIYKYKQFDPDLIKELKEISLSQNFINQVVKDYTPEYLKEKIALLKKLKENSKIEFLNPAGFVRKAILEDYKSWEKGKQEYLFPPNPELEIKKEITKETRRKKVLSQVRKELNANEKEKLLQEARERLQQDRGKTTEKVPQTALKAYFNILLEERLAKKEAVNY